MCVCVCVCVCVYVLGKVEGGGGRDWSLSVQPHRGRQQTGDGNGETADREMKEK